MNLEENRLRSFSAWPANAPVEPQQLARSGFFATDSFLEAECNWCHRRISQWQYGQYDQVQEQHRLAEPLCAFLVNPANCGNVPLDCYGGIAASPPPTSDLLSNIATTSQQQQEQSQQLQAQSQQQQQPPVNLLIEANRLATFKNWPNPNISPQSLAKAGFFYLNRSDEVKCAWCKGVIAKWEKQDNAFEEHQRFFPDCPRVQLGPLIEMASDGIRDLGIQQISPPRKPKFSSLDARLRTYVNWPVCSDVRPEALAQAGLYYQDKDDQVRCFHCNIGLRSWQKEDDPWFEHAKWYPQCQFVRLVKGCAYVQQVQNLTRQSAAAQLPPHVPVVPSMTIDEAMSTAPVLQALEIGIDGGSIRNATQRQLLTVGRPYDTVEDLVKAVFEGREDDDASASQDGGEVAGAGTIVREVSRIINSIFGATDGGGQHIHPAAGSAITLASSEDMCQQASGQQATVQPAVNLAPTAAAPLTVQTGNCSNLGATAAAAAPESTFGASNEPQTLPSREGLSPGRSLLLVEENRKLKDARLCKVCLDDEVGVVFLPCGHLVTCVQCAPGVNQCPMCRTAIKGFVRTYLS